MDTIDSAAFQLVADRHFAIWNEADPATRAARYASVYTESIFVADYAGAATGYAQLDAKIGEVHGKHAGFIFTPAPADWNHGMGRITWSYGPAASPQLVRGEDIITIENGRIASLHVFIDPT